MLRGRFLVKEAESHVVILLLLVLFILLLLGGGSTSGGRGGAHTASDDGDQRLQVGRLRSLGKESGPVGLNLDTGGLDDGGQLLGRDGDIVVGEDEGGVGAGKLRGGHCASFFLADLAQKLRTSNLLL